ncbi:hypothetical protein [Pandoravirus japonicus]|uniref:Uncharacterized protein n=1 Tax=Pandoravirus japonicus TaxID=2823154 RepID=A0A811BN28_9VIRU|nr:hypothetical protein [Pandoravirus japonicus]
MCPIKNSLPAQRRRARATHTRERQKGKLKKKEEKRDAAVATPPTARTMMAAKEGEGQRPIRPLVVHLATAEASRPAIHRSRSRVRPT